MSSFLSKGHKYEKLVEDDSDDLSDPSHLPARKQTGDSSTCSIYFTLSLILNIILLMSFVPLYFNSEKFLSQSAFSLDEATKIDVLNAFHDLQHMIRNMNNKQRKERMSGDMQRLKVLFERLEKMSSVYNDVQSTSVAETSQKSVKALEPESTESPNLKQPDKQHKSIKTLELEPKEIHDLKEPEKQEKTDVIEKPDSTSEKKSENNIKPVGKNSASISEKKTNGKMSIDDFKWKDGTDDPELHELVAPEAYRRGLIDKLKNHEDIPPKFRNQHIMIIGDSTDRNIMEEICDPWCEIMRNNCLGRSEDSLCFNCDLTQGCHYEHSNVTFSSFRAGYGIHPYGPIPYTPDKQYKTVKNESLKERFEEYMKIDIANMDLVKYPPTAFIFQINLWFWFRMQWWNGFEYKEYREDEAMRNNLNTSYVHNLTIFQEVVSEMFPSVEKFYFMTHSLSGPMPRYRLDAHKVGFINALVREIVKKIPRVELIDLDRLTREVQPTHIQTDDHIHPKKYYNLIFADFIYNSIVNGDIDYGDNDLPILSPLVGQ